MSPGSLEELDFAIIEEVIVNLSIDEETHMDRAEGGGGP